MMRKIKFQNVLFLLFTVFVGIILMVSGIVFYTYTINQMEIAASDNQMNTTIKVQEQITTVLAEMDRIAIAVNASDYIVTTLSEIPPDTDENYFDYHPQVTSEIKNVLYSIMSSKMVNARIKLVSRNYDNTGISTQYDKSIEKTEIRNSSMGYEDMMTSDTYKFFIPTHDDIWTSYNSSVISVVRPIRNNYGGVFGFVEINLPILELDKMVDGINIAVLDNQNKVVYSNAELTAGQTGLIEAYDYNQKDGTILTGNSHGLIVSYSRMENTGWRIVQYTDQNIYNYPMRSIGRIVLVTYVTIFLFMVLIIYLIVRAVTKPVRRLTDIVLDADAKDPNLHLKAGEMQGEMEMLAKSVQGLIETVHESSNQLVEIKTREMKTQIMALEAQLNPHFIYNTLSVIGAYGMKASNEIVYQMCLDLSEMLRYTIDFNMKNATINTEIDHVNTYLSLMKKRYDKLFMYTIDNQISDEIIIVPKLIIQPIVENCFLHGFTNTEAPWKIDIRIYTIGNEWRVRIKDNGSGFSQEDIDSIGSTLNREDFLQKKSGIGMVNTFLRLRHYFKGKEYIRFYSEDGAVVEIGGPIKYENY